MTKPRIPIEPETFLKSGSEDGNQIALFCWAQQNLDKYPELKFLFAIPNGGSRHIAEAGKLVAMGVKRGVPDIFLAVPKAGWHGLFIELKRPVSVGKKAGKTSEHQDIWIDDLRSQCYGVAVCYGFEEAKNTLIQYLKYGK